MPLVSRSPEDLHPNPSRERLAFKTSTVRLSVSDSKSWSYRELHSGLVRAGDV